MAIDTAAKRRAILAFGGALALPFPSGSDLDSAAERFVVLGIYAVDEAAPGAAVSDAISIPAGAFLTAFKGLTVKMNLSSITSGLVSGADTVACPSTILGGVNISADGTNACTVVVRRNSASGAVVFHQVTKSPMFVMAPINAAATLYYSVTGTGGLAQFYEWTS